MRRRSGIALAVALMVATVGSWSASAAPTGPTTEAARIIAYWSSERIASAIPRDLAIDPRGLAYLRLPGGALQPYAHPIPAQPSPTAIGDPTIWNLDPASGATIGASYTLRADVTDPQGVRSVGVRLQKGSGTVQSFSASNSGGSTWSVSLQGFTDGSWSWWLVAKDGATRGGKIGRAHV